MALQVPVDFAALVRIALPGQEGNMGSLADLGYTENGCEITMQRFQENVSGDENGGTQGPPIDISVYGEIHMIRLNLTRYDPIVAAALEALVPGATPGAASVVTPAFGTFTPGQLLFQGRLFTRLLVQTQLRPRNYHCAIIRNPIEINKGTKASRFMMVAECHRHPVTKVLYDNAIV